MAAAAAVAAASPCFEVLDTLGGLFTLTRASPTLDGSIPLRAAQACTPFLEGNRAGFQLELGQRLELARTLGRVTLREPPERLVRLLRGSVPRLTVEGLLPPHGALAKRLGRGLVWREGQSSRVSLFTGLFVRPRPGIVLRLGHAGNRKNVLFDVEERWLTDATRFEPIVLCLELGGEARFPLSLHGELASLMPLSPRVRLGRADLGDAAELGRAHFAFYDQKYFEQKKRGATKKYKRLLSRETDRRPAADGELLAVTAGPSSIAAVRAPVPHLVFENAVAFQARFDGHDTQVEPERRALEELARSTRAAWAKVFDAETLERHRGALWYFTKYVTPHQAGEPLFFVKPPALLRTSPGWSTLVEGLPGPGYEVLRGVVATDRFHALPAVFRLGFPGRRVVVKAGAPLARFIPVPRQLLDAGFERVDWSFA